MRGFFKNLTFCSDLVQETSEAKDGQDPRLSDSPFHRVVPFSRQRSTHPGRSPWKGIGLGAFARELYRSRLRGGLPIVVRIEAATFSLVAGQPPATTDADQDLFATGLGLQTPDVAVLAQSVAAGRLQAKERTPTTDDGEPM